MFERFFSAKKEASAESEPTVPEVQEQPEVKKLEPFEDYPLLQKISLDHDSRLKDGAPSRIELMVASGDKKNNESICNTFIMSAIGELDSEKDIKDFCDQLEDFLFSKDRENSKKEVHGNVMNRIVGCFDFHARMGDDLKETWKKWTSAVFDIIPAKHGAFGLGKVTQIK